MTLLRCAVMALVAATVEVGNLTLLVGRYQLGSERYADTLPALRQVNILLVSRSALIPHQVVCVEVVSERSIEVLMVNQQMVVGGLQVALYQMAMNRCYRSLMHETIACRVVIVTVVNRFCEVTGKHIVRHLVVILSRSINQQVLRLVTVDDTGQTVIIEQRSVELTILPAQLIRLMGPISFIGIIVSLEVNSRHVRISLCSRIVLLGLCQISLRVEVSHTHGRVAEVSRSTIDAVRIAVR